MATVQELEAAVRDVPDFPKPGIVFKDITPVLGDARLFKGCLELLAETAGGQRVDKVVGIDARGFIFAAGVAHLLGTGFVPVRKEGKLPWTTQKMAYTLEYGESVVEIHEDAIQPGEKVLLVDDLLATGGTAAAAVKLLRALEADLVAISFLIELQALQGRDKLGSAPIHSLLKY
ncbi:adenine phosphoribosyltransferase [Roseibacillus ishigakijimensis]|uniref:Adenine phosphoribosyltransferase n=1 Tax=Roseibacillus ishigakijimensis TaxID=454146 RepID=A0A934RTY4_9BACT|nr:adenine phosphoribosyltransferase [Roseibacillus ishigakijimensis]MBK1834984.1 adenine phosphoribosyltransferase [Roseibacillus ishigakijimensis]